jgi:membrane fusion protein, multidrug efflux system
MAQKVAPQALGFQPLKFAPPTSAPAKPAPLPMRPKGRWFVGLLLIGACAFAGHQVWSSHFRYQAYGTVAGKSIEVSPPWDGVLVYVHHRVGDRVRQGEPLMTVDNLELRHRSAQITDELRVEQAKLEAEAARIKWESAYSLDQSRGALASYYELNGSLLEEESKLEEISNSLTRMTRLAAQRAVAKAEVDRLHFAKEGQRKKISMLKEALVEQKRRADEAEVLLKSGKELSAGLVERGREQLKPNLARITALQAERSRLQERLVQGEVRAPTNGIVLKHLRQAGESCKANQPIVSLLDEGSLEVVLYMHQDDSAAFAPGAGLNVQFDPYDKALHCTVVRLGDQFEQAPEHIKRYYREGEKLLPVYLQPSVDDERWMALRVNGVVKLPRTAAVETHLVKQ